MRHSQEHCFFKVHCNLRLVDNIEEIGRTDANIDWSSDGDLDWLTDIKAAFELLVNFYELYSKCFELHNYALK